MVLSAIVDISSRKRLEERFRQVVESAPNAMVMISAQRQNRDGERPGGTRVRLRAQGDARASRSRCSSRSASEAITRLCAARSSPSLCSRPMGAGRDLYGLKKDGSEFPIEIGLNPIETDEGPMVLSAIVDITSRKRLEERFRQVVESAPNAMVMISRARQDRDGECAGRNACSAMTRKEMLGQSIEMLVPERFRGTTRSCAARSSASPVSRPMGAGRDLYRLEEGRQRVSDRDRSEPHRDGRRAMVLSAIVDITSRKRLEERFRQVVESAPNAMVMISAGGKIEMVNAQAERVFGYERKELLGSTDRDAGAGAVSQASPGSARLVLRRLLSRAPWVPAAICTGCRGTAASSRSRSG